jgi:hypothetical protein
MGKKAISDKKVVMKIAKILVGRLKRFSLPADMDAETAIRQLIANKAYPLISYGELAAELNQALGLEDSPARFKPIHLDAFLAILLKESINFEYSVGGIVHSGRIREKTGRSVPITAIVVNARQCIPGKSFFAYFDLPRANDDERMDSAVQLMGKLFAYSDWKAYMKAVQKIFGDK